MAAKSRTSLIVRLDPKTGCPRFYKRTVTPGKIKAHDPNDKTVGEAINQMQSAIKLRSTLNASPNNFRGLLG